MFYIKPYSFTTPDFTTYITHFMNLIRFTLHFSSFQNSPIQKKSVINIQKPCFAYKNLIF